MRVTPVRSLRGRVTVPGDKSISHRALILGAVADGKNHIRGWLPAGDTLATLACIRQLGVDVQREGETTLRFSGGHLTPPDTALDCANAGTCMRLLAGLLAGQPFESVLDGSPQLRKRPMRRITEPLQAMGAVIQADDGRAPLHITPAQLHGGTHDLNVASAQVKSAILLAGLHAEGETVVIEPGPSRDHTEIMLRAMGVALHVDGRTITLSPPPAALAPLDMHIPGDISSAAFLLVAAASLHGSEVWIENVGLNPTRTGLLDILRLMGADITVEEQHLSGGEPLGTLHVRGGELRGTVIEGDVVVRAIDELPAISAAALLAEGQTTIRDAAELRVKEVDRIAVVAGELRKLGAAITEHPDGLTIEGGHALQGAALDSHGDHRIGMMGAVAGLFAEGETRIHDAACIADSFPGFAAIFNQIGADIQ